MHLTKLNVPTRLSKLYLKKYRRFNNIKPKNYRTQLCKFHLSKTCTKGDKCTYSHDLKKFPCKAFHLRNNCNRKICPFSHQPLNDDELERLKEDAKCEDLNIASPFDN